MVVMQAWSLCQHAIGAGALPPEPTRRMPDKCLLRLGQLLHKCQLVVILSVEPDFFDSTGSQL